MSIGGSGWTDSRLENAILRLSFPSTADAPEISMKDIMGFCLCYTIAPVRFKMNNKEALSVLSNSGTSFKFALKSEKQQDVRVEKISEADLTEEDDISWKSTDDDQDDEQDQDDDDAEKLDVHETTQEEEDDDDHNDDENDQEDDDDHNDDENDQ
ncbi:hypothetical protein Tco_1339472 [Tanacetum coccineum]